MKFDIEQKGNNFLVVNDTTGAVKGRFIKKGEAQVHQQKLQKEHDDEIRRSSASLTAPE